MQGWIAIQVGLSTSTRFALLMWLLGALSCGDPGQKAVIDRPKELALDLGSSVRMEVLFIPAGRFMMGSPGGRFEHERPVHEVVISQPFYMGRCPVTQEQWHAIMADNPSCFKGSKNPVDGVSWEKAQDFCRKLEERTGKTVRLPTEAEWEFACRAGSTTRYCFGDDENGLAEYAWFEGNSGRTTHAVGQKGPNAWGLCDMHGNVWEWCQDWYDPGYYAESPRADPQGPAEGTLSPHVLRGGAWHVEAVYCQSASRGGDFPCGEGGPGSWDDSGRTGFRVVVTLSKTKVFAP